MLHIIIGLEERKLINSAQKGNLPEGVKRFSLMREENSFFLIAELYLPLPFCSLTPVCNNLQKREVIFCE